MAALVRCRVLFQTVRCQTSIINGVCRSDSVLRSFLTERHAFTGGVRPHSSDVKSGDDLIVRHLDGEDSGRQPDTGFDDHYTSLTSVTQSPFSLHCPIIQRFASANHLSLTDA